MAGPTTEQAVCFTCSIVDQYVGLANRFTQDLSKLLIVPMWTLFLAIVGPWIVLEGIKMVLGRTDIAAFFKQLTFVIIASFLLSGQGPSLVNTIYNTSLSIMGSAAGVALSVGGQTPVAAKTAPTASDTGLKPGTGLTPLVRSVESAIRNVFSMAAEMASTWTPLSPFAILYALLLVIPFFIVLVVYFAQVVVAMFRVIMLASLSPFIMLGFGFGWGRGMAASAVKTLLSAFMVLFGATAAVAITIYGINSLHIGQVPKENIRDLASITNPKYLLAVAMGWMGTAFLTEATAIANSITGSVLTNTAAGIITAGAGATAALISKHPAVRGLGKVALATAGGGTMTSAGAGVASHLVSNRAAELVHVAKNGPSAANLKNVVKGS